MSLDSSGQVATREIARTFVEARRARRGLTRFPGAAPATLEEAYAVQDMALRFAGGTVEGWKLGRIWPPLDLSLGANRLAGPIFADTIVAASEARAPVMPVFADGFAAAEAEFMLRLGRAPDLHRRDYTPQEARAFVDAVHIGIEIASSPYPGINADGPAVTVADFGNNNGLVVGEAIEGWRDIDLDSWSVETLVNGAIVGTGCARDMLDGPFGAAAFLFNLMADRGIALVAGTWISSGAVTGVHPVAIGDHVEARFDVERTVRCTIASY